MYVSKGKKRRHPVKDSETTNLVTPICSILFKQKKKEKTNTKRLFEKQCFWYYFHVR